MKQIKLIRRNIRSNKNIFVFLFIFGLIGIISGSLLAIVLDGNDSKLVTEYLNNFLSSIINNSLNFKSSFLNSLLCNIGSCLSVWFLGISIIGIPLILIIYFSKSFILGFSVSSIIINYKMKGCLIAFAYIFPHLIFNILNIACLSAYSLSLSFKLFNVFLHKESFNFKSFRNKYFLILIFSLISFAISSLFEVFISPFFLKFVLGNKL